MKFPSLEEQVEQEYLRRYGDPAEHTSKQQWRRRFYLRQLLMNRCVDCGDARLPTHIRCERCFARQRVAENAAYKRILEDPNRCDRCGGPMDKELIGRAICYICLDQTNKSHPKRKQ